MNNGDSGKSGQLPVYVQRSVCFLKLEFHYLKEVRQKKSPVSQVVTLLS